MCDLFPLSSSELWMIRGEEVDERRGWQRLLVAVGVSSGRCSSDAIPRLVCNNL